MPNPSIAAPSLILLILFLAYTSQPLLARLPLPPGPLTTRQTLVFNLVISFVWICYSRACLTDPGIRRKGVGGERREEGGKKERWCRKCGGPKPERAHHCRVCGKCIPKMDHHCPWTANCVSHYTFPHFLRFLFYAVLAMSYLEYFLLIRAEHLWKQRNLPSYLGPSIYQLIHLLSLFCTNSIVLFLVSILFARTLWSLVTNTYTIEGWEIERHEALVRRARKLGGYVEGPGGIRVWITKQEFPYDIGVWENVKQGMGSGNILSWFSPFSSTPSPESGLSYEVNGFEDPSLTWPPPDPEKIRYSRSPSQQQQQNGSYTSTATQPDVLAFLHRQGEDFRRRRALGNYHYQQQPQEPRELVYGTEGSGLEEEKEYRALDTSPAKRGEWTNSDGDRLKDFGVEDDDEEEDNIPLAELIRRRSNIGVTAPQPPDSEPDPERIKKQL